MAKCPVCLKDAGAGRAFEWHFKTHAAKKAGQTSNRPTPLSQLRAAKQKAANESLQMTEIPETLSMPMVSHSLTSSLRNIELTLP